MLFRIPQKPGTESSTFLGLCGGVLFGAGFWQTTDRGLELKTTQLIEGRWRRGHSWKDTGERLLQGDRIASQNRSEFVLADGRKFIRQQESSNVYSQPHAHPWYLISEGWGKHRASKYVRVFSQPAGKATKTPLPNLVLQRLNRGNAKAGGPPRPMRPKNVRFRIGDDGFVPKMALLNSGDAIEIAEIQEQAITDHHISISWIRNALRGFAPPIKPPLIYQRKIEHAEPGLVPIRCIIHDDEKAYFAVTGHGDIAGTDARGEATLRDWPIGHQWVRLQHPDYDLRQADIWIDGEKVENDRGKIRLNNNEDYGRISIRVSGLLKKD